jgi:hypothetical protein
MSEEQLHAAIKALQSGDKREARRLLGDLLREDGDNTAAWWYLAEALDDREQKARCLRQVLRLHPDHGAARRMLADLDRRVAKVTPPEGLDRPVFEAKDQGGILFVPGQPEEVPAQTQPQNQRRGSPILMAGVVVCVILLLFAGAGALFLPPILHNWPGIQRLEPTPTLRPLVFAVQDCASTGQSATVLVFANETDVEIEILQGEPGKETSLFVLAPGEQKTIDVQPGVQLRYAAETEAPGFASQGAIIQVPKGSSCRVPIR